MICPDCRGSGIAYPYCQTCQGFGIIHCCEGERPSLPLQEDESFDWAALQKLRKTAGY